MNSDKIEALIWAVFISVSVVVHTYVWTVALSQPPLSLKRDVTSDGKVHQ